MVSYDLDDLFLLCDGYRFLSMYIQSTKIKKLFNMQNISMQNVMDVHKTSSQSYGADHVSSTASLTNMNVIEGEKLCAMRSFLHSLFRDAVFKVEGSDLNLRHIVQYNPPLLFHIYLCSVQDIETVNENLIWH